MDNIIKYKNMIFRKNKDGNTLSLIEYQDNFDKDYIIPEVVENYKVFAIASKAFNKVSLYNKVLVIPKSIKYISGEAFIGSKFDIYVPLLRTTFDKKAFQHSKITVFCNQNEIGEINEVVIVENTLLDKSKSYIYKIENDRVTIISFINERCIKSFPNEIDGYLLNQMSSEQSYQILVNMKFDSRLLTKNNLELLLKEKSLFEKLSSNTWRFQDYYINQTMDEIKYLLTNISEEYRIEKYSYDINMYGIYKNAVKGNIVLRYIDSDTLLEQDGINYYVKNNECHIVGFAHFTKQIPEKIDGFPVSTIQKGPLEMIVDMCNKGDKITLPIRLVYCIFENEDMLAKNDYSSIPYLVVSDEESEKSLIKYLGTKYKIYTESYNGEIVHRIVFSYISSFTHTNCTGSVKLSFIRSKLMEYKLPAHIGEGTFRYYINTNNDIYIDSFEGKDELIPYYIDNKRVIGSYNSGGHRLKHIPEVYIHANGIYEIFNKELKVYKEKWLYEIKDDKANLKYFIGYVNSDFDIKNAILVPSLIENKQVSLSYSSSIQIDKDFTAVNFQEKCSIKLVGYVENVERIVNLTSIPFEIESIIFDSNIQKMTLCFSDIEKIMENIKFLNVSGEELGRYSTYKIIDTLKNKKELISKDEKVYYSTDNNSLCYDKLVQSKDVAQNIIRILPNIHLHDESWIEEEYDSDGAFGYPLRWHTEHEKYSVSDIVYNIEVYEIYSNIIVNDYSLLTVMDATIAALQYLSNPSVEVQLEALKRNGYNILKIKNPSTEALKYMFDHKLCPKCGAKLAAKSGIYGSFFGCPNYPKCTYTRNI